MGARVLNAFFGTTLNERTKHLSPHLDKYRRGIAGHTNLFERLQLGIRKQ